MQSLRICIGLLFYNFIIPAEANNGQGVLNNSTELKQEKTSFIFVNNQTEYRWEPSNSGAEEYKSNGTNVIEGDIFIDESSSLYSKRKAAYGYKRWNNKTIPWKFDMGDRKFDSPASFSIIKTAIRIMENNSCLHFPMWTKEKVKELGSDYLDIGKGSGCGTYVGYRQYRHHLFSLEEKSCLKIGVVIHELCHAIGFYHEHARRDRNKYVIVNYENIKPSRKTNFNILLTSYNYAQYDYQSVMQYGPLAYSKNFKNTVTSKDEHLLFLLGQRAGLSFYDRKSVNLFYECSDSCEPPLKSCKFDGYIDKSCKCYCPSGLKGADCSKVESEGECGGFLSLNFKNPHAQINFDSSLNVKAKRCIWLIQSPSLTRMKFAIEHLNLTKTRYICVQWLEIRYNLIGQNGPRFCGLNGKINHLFNTTGNVAMFVLESSKDLDKAAFNVKLSILTEYDADINCTFELGNDFCVFNQIGGFDKWLISSDVKGVKELKGHRFSEKYIYLKPATTPGNIDGVLESRMIPGGRKCIRLYYIIRAEAGAYYRLFLSYSTKTERSEPVALVESTNMWQKYELFVVSEKDFKVAIWGAIMNGKHGYIALDDISIEKGLCSGELETILMTEGLGIKCKFENDFCNYEWNPIEETVFTAKSSTERCPDGCLVVSPLKTSEVRSPVQAYKGDSCLAIKYKVKEPAELDINLDVFDPNKNKTANVWRSTGSTESLNFTWIINDINVDFVLIQFILTVTSQGNSAELFVSDIWFDSKPCQESLSTCNYENSLCMFRFVDNGTWQDASQGVTFGNERISISEKNHFENQRWLMSPSNKQTLRSSLMYLNGEGCLSFKYNPHGLPQKGITLTKINAYDGYRYILWKSDSKQQFENPFVQINIESKGFFSLEFSTLKEDIFGNYEIEDFELNSDECIVISPGIRTLHQH